MAHVVDSFMAALRSFDFPGRPLDVRETSPSGRANRRAFIHEHFPDTGCAIAVEFKKVFMRVDGRAAPEVLAALRRLLASTLPALTRFGAGSMKLARIPSRGRGHPPIGWRRRWPQSRQAGACAKEFEGGGPASTSTAPCLFLCVHLAAATGHPLRAKWSARNASHLLAPDAARAKPIVAPIGKLLEVGFAPSWCSNGRTRAG